MLSELVLPAPAKLNLFLHIIGRRADGYHRLQSLFQFLDFGDELTFFLDAEHRGIELVSTLSGVPHEDNLIVKAARLLQETSGVGMGVRIHLEKHLPMGGGLGGGSSNAATTLLGLNALWGLGFSEDRLAELGLQLGADVPVFVRGRSAFAEGIGEILTPVCPQECWYLVLVPDVHVDTAAMYGHKDLTRNSPPIKVCAALEQGGGPQQERTQQNQRLLAQRNDFEPLVRRLYPEVDKSLALLDNLAHLSSGLAMMSGSGASVFAPFSSHEQALEAEASVKSSCGLLERGSELPQKLRSFVVRGVNCSPLMTALQDVGCPLPE